MTRHVFYRDFSVCRAYVLAALIGLALVLTGHSGAKLAEVEAEPLLHKATYVVIKAKDCPGDKGVDL